MAQHAARRPTLSDARSKRPELDARDVKYDVDQPEQLTAGFVDLLRRTRRPVSALRIGRLVQQRIREADHSIERRAQFVAHRGEEARLGLVRRLCRFLGAAELGLRSTRLGHIGECGHPAAGRGRIGTGIENPRRPG